MTVPALPETSPNPVSPKVKAAAATTFAATLVLAVLGAVLDNRDLLSFLPDPVTVIIVAVIPALVALLSGYAAVDPLRLPTLRRH